MAKKFKVVYNACYGGFGISYTAYKWLIEHGLEEQYLNRDSNDQTIDSRKYVMIIRDENGKLRDVRDTKIEQHHSDDDLNILCNLYLNDIPRHHPLLVKCVEELGKNASGSCANLYVETIYSRIYKINEVDGYESVQEIDGEDVYVIDESDLIFCK